MLRERVPCTSGGGRVSSYGGGCLRNADSLSRVSARSEGEPGLNRHSDWNLRKPGCDDFGARGSNVIDAKQRMKYSARAVIT